ncbi:uncharacterized protein LOC131061348 [Cryptomeria japonica]|uniref:uncharacterized protein LOC131061348 n=1 Tax=Cryptomeria japonica TaxID=3369 RepID=UPI0025ACDA2B|nr:uncharacterized protein LOC131061348 [Cryptomeria japonica]
MYLKKPPWAEELLSSSSSPSSSSSSSSSSASSLSSSSSSSAALVVDLVKSLNKERLYREFTLTLTTALRNASAEFSFVRSKGLSTLLKFASSLSESDYMVELFQETQTLAHLQVVPVLFANSLAPSDSYSVQTLDHNSDDDSTKVTSPPTDNEVTLALCVLEGCCLLDRGSRTLAHQHMAIKKLIGLLSSGGINQQAACLDAFAALMLDSPENQKEFERSHGVRQIAQLAKTRNIDEKVRIKSAEFLLLLVGNLLPSTKFTHSLEYEEEREEGLKMESLQDDILEVLGEEIASLLWAVGQLGSFDSQKKQPSLQFQAQHLVDSLDSQLW